MRSSTTISRVCILNMKRGRKKRKSLTLPSQDLWLTATETGSASFPCIMPWHKQSSLHVARNVVFQCIWWRSLISYRCLSLFRNSRSRIWLWFLRLLSWVVSFPGFMPLTWFCISFLLSLVYLLDREFASGGNGGTAREEAKSMRRRWKTWWKWKTSWQPRTGTRPASYRRLALVHHLENRV